MMSYTNISSSLIKKKKEKSPYIQDMVRYALSCKYKEINEPAYYCIKNYAFMSKYIDRKKCASDM